MPRSGKATRNKSHLMPKESTLYEKVIPILLVIMAVVMVILILFALGVFVGIVPFP